MKIIIAGAGDVGFHLAKLLSYESQDTYVIDLDGEKLNYINNHLDVITKRGDATSIALLKEVGIESADLLLAVTESQNTNFTVSVIGKALGVKKTIARIKNPEFLDNDIIEILDDFSEKAKNRNIDIHIISEKGEVSNPESFIEYFKLRPDLTA